MACTVISHRIFGFTRGVRHGRRIDFDLATRRRDRRLAGGVARQGRRLRTAWRHRGRNNRRIYWWLAVAADRRQFWRRTGSSHRKRDDRRCRAAGDFAPRQARLSHELRADSVAEATNTEVRTMTATALHLERKK